MCSFDLDRIEIKKAFTCFSKFPRSTKYIKPIKLVINIHFICRWVTSNLPCVFTWGWSGVVYDNTTGNECRDNSYYITLECHYM